MTAVQKHLGTIMLLLSCAAAQNSAQTATVQSVTAVRDGSDLRVEVTLSSPVQPSFATASNPERILIDLPNTASNDNVQNVAINENGVRRVRAGQHTASPLVTRLVIDLDQPHSYSVKTEGNRIIVTVGGIEKARNVSRGAPVAATSGNLIGVFRRHKETVPAAAEDNSDSATLPVPPATAVPGFEPPPDDSSKQIPLSPEATAALAHAPVAPNSKSAAPAPPSAPLSNMPPSAGAQTAGASSSVAEIPLSPEAQAALAHAPVPPSPKREEPAPLVSTAATTPPSVRPEIAPTGADAPTVAPMTPNSRTEATIALAKPEAVTTPPSAPGAHADAAAAVSSENAPVSSAEESAAASPTVLATAPASPAETSTLIARTDDPSLRTIFRVKYVADGVAYLEGGRAQGLAEGMKLEVEDTNLPATQGQSASSADPKVVAELEVSGVAETSAVTDIHAPKRPVKAGDLAYLSSGDAEALVAQRALSATRQYPAVISFTEGDTLDEEAREEVPRPPLPSVNRARGRIGFDAIETISHGTSSVTSSDVGMVFRGDITRIGGTYWNLSGYWRGRLTKESVAAQQTLQNLINRTYHLNMTYDNPNSTLVAGFGRLYLPWAPSLDTIDGGYFGKRLSKGGVLGVFGGSTPDPSSWDYSPNRVISGAFVNFEGGEFDGFHYSTTSGAGVSMVNWAIDRPFVFFEDSLSYKRTFAVYESAQIDDPRGNSATPSPGVGLGRNFFTFRVNPHPRVEFDFNYNYFRDIPTFDPTLVGTGLLDKYLFQGFSAGGRVEVWNQIWLSTNLGRSSGTGDAQTSLNQMYGITFGRLPWVKLRADAHYARFNSSFGNGSYESMSLSRQMSDRLRLEMLVGQQNFASALTTNNRGRFLTGTIETTLGPHYYLQGSFTTNRGDMSYDQFMFSIGYRFDSKRRGE